MADKRGKKRSNGQGSVYQRKDGIWVGAAYVLTTTGHRKRITVSAKTKTEADRKLRKKINDSDNGVPVAAESWTLGAYLEHWLANVVRHRRPKTYQGYEGVVRRYLVPGLGKKKLATLKAPEMRAFFTRLEHDCRCCADGIDADRPVDQQKCCALGRCCDKRLSVRTIQFIHAVLRNALQQAMREELVMRNVATLVQVKTPKYRVNRGLELADARKLLRESEDDRLHALYVLALYLGLRRAELLGLRWEDVDLNEGALELVQTLQRVGGELMVVPTKTAGSTRTIPLPSVCIRALRAHQDRQIRERESAEVWKDSGLVFTNTIGRPLEPGNLRRSWHPLRDRIGLPETRFHDLRHSCVSLLLDVGVPPHIVARIVGHSDSRITMSIYAHASLDEQREALDRLEDHL
ncbi:tyrosine-type recombinase/integrase [Allosaccharopolyspora coralli]|uniref:Tyrosine-type recombinase/integrase n=1 Tax=Allosaccharopolyspora coralli TaxID=2665642 RepID=A0A5Q3QC92_9PSEU|nr:site-specific integrase [Allosaccharopolyspora coralli]QGK71973.1 tyrosine-type recombinase/integrase [Allosaccharopolyspora coralli]